MLAADKLANDNLFLIHANLFRCADEWWQAGYYETQRIASTGDSTNLDAGFYIVRKSDIPPASFRNSKPAHWLTHVLRHSAKADGLAVSTDGWVSISDLIMASGKRFETPLNAKMLGGIVRNDPNDRYEAKANKGSIITHLKATCAHSPEMGIDVAALRNQGIILAQDDAAPRTMFHGTYEVALSGILSKGLLRGGTGRGREIFCSPCTTSSPSNPLGSQKQVDRRGPFEISIVLDVRQMIVDGYRIYYDKGGSLIVSERDILPCYILGVVNLTNGTIPYLRPFQIHFGKDRRCPSAEATSSGWEQGGPAMPMTKASADQRKTWSLANDEPFQGLVSCSTQMFS